MRIHKLIVVETLRRLGAPGALGALLVVGSAGIALASLWPASHRLEASRSQLVEARARQTDPALRQAPPLTAAQQLAAIQSTLPPRKDATLSIERIYAAARKEGVALAKGEYVLVADQNAHVVRYQINLPVRSDYRKIRRFINTLASVPYLGLDEVSLQRQQIAETELDVRIRMTLFVGKS